MAVEVAPVGVLEDGTVFYAPLGEVLHDGDDLVCCHLCGRWLRNVGGTPSASRARVDAGRVPRGVSAAAEHPDVFAGPECPHAAPRAGATRPEGVRDAAQRCWRQHPSSTRMAIAR